MSGSNIINSFLLKSEKENKHTEIGPYIIRLKSQILYTAQNTIPVVANHAITIFTWRCIAVQIKITPHATVIWNIWRTLYIINIT